MTHENHVQSILVDEGLDQVSFPLGIQKSEALINTSIKLFRQILSDGDQRWGIVNSWLEIINKPNIRGIHREVALGAKYLSSNPSFRNEYGKYVREENLRQLCRTINNLRADTKLQSIFENIYKNTLPNLHLEKTNKITLGTMQDGITGCPESLYQIRLFSDENKEKYLGRLGFNMHHEQPGWIMSITNLQGIPDGNDLYDKLRRNGIEPFNVLVQTAKTLANEFDPNIQIRSLRNPATEYSALINTVCKREGVKRYYFYRN